jgi:hypothetical protein
MKNFKIILLVLAIQFGTLSVMAAERNHNIEWPVKYNHKHNNAGLFRTLKFKQQKHNNRISQQFQQRKYLKGTSKIQDRKIRGNRLIKKIKL